MILEPGLNGWLVQINIPVMEILKVNPLLGVGSSNLQNRTWIRRLSRLFFRLSMTAPRRVVDTHPGYSLQNS